MHLTIVPDRPDRDYHNPARAQECDSGLTGLPTIVSNMWRLGKWLLVAVALAALALLTLMTFMRRDHKVELVVTYPNSSPEAVWRLLTDHAAEPTWLKAFGTVTREADLGGHEVWTHSTPDQAFRFTLMTVSAVEPQRYERLLLRDNQPRNQSWDGRWVYELQPEGRGTVLRITEYGWTDGLPFFLAQRVFADPDGFLKHYATALGTALGDQAKVQVIRSH